MFHPSSIEPDVELRVFLQNKVRVGLAGGGSQMVTVYGDWERPTNMLPDDFIVIYQNGDVEGIGMENDFARGYIMVGLYSKLNDDGSVKKNRVKKLLHQLDVLFMDTSIDPPRYRPIITDNYIFEYDAQRFITPTTPNQTSGYSITNLNLRWHTTNNFNKE